MPENLVLNLSIVLSGGAGNYVLQNYRLLQKLGYDSYMMVKVKLLKEMLWLFNVIIIKNKIC